MLRLFLRATWVIQIGTPFYVSPHFYFPVTADLLSLITNIQGKNIPTGKQACIAWMGMCESNKHLTKILEMSDPRPVPHLCQHIVYFYQILKMIFLYRNVNGYFSIIYSHLKLNFDQCT